MVQVMTKTKEGLTQTVSPSIMTKFQVAMQYFPGQLENSDSAVRRLVRWIDNTRGLLPALEQAGYRRSQHGFTKRQVEIVYEYLGEP